MQLDFFRIHLSADVLKFFRIRYYKCKIFDNMNKRHVKMGIILVNKKLNFICKNKVWNIMFSFCTTFIKPLIPSHLVDDLGLCTTVSCSLDTTPGFIGRYTWTIFIFNATRPIKFIYQIFISYSDRNCFYEIENEF